MPAQKQQSPANRSSAFSLDQLIRLDNTYLPIDKTQAATYPIINGSTAFALLRSNLTRSLTSVEPINAASQPSILHSARVSFANLVYLEPEPQNAEYLQPVWLFEGRGQSNVGDVLWTAMVPAIDSQAMQRLVGN